MARAKPRREHLLQVAYKLFNQNGYHATGIDLILETAGVSKATLYKYFPSKEDMILEILKRRHEELIEMRNQRFETLGEKASLEEKVSALFDGLADWFASDQFCGCNFIHAAGEFGYGHPIRQWTAQHKLENQAFIQKILGPDFEHLAIPIATLMEGSIVLAHVTGQKDAVQSAKETALSLLKN